MKCFDTKKYIKDFFVWHTHTENLVEIRDLSACKCTDVAKAMERKSIFPPKKSLLRSTMTISIFLSGYKYQKVFLKC